MTLDLDKSRWERVRFGDVVRNHNDYFDRERDGELPYVAGPHIDPQSATVANYGSTDDDDFPPTFKRMFQPGDVLLHSRGIEKIAVPDRPGVTGEKLFVLRTMNPSILDQRFLPWLLRSERAGRYFVNNFSGSVNKFLNWRPLADFEFDLPPLPEQQRLADLLWAVERHRSLLIASQTTVRLHRRRAVDQAIKTAIAQNAARLDAVAEIRGGIQVGKPVTGSVVERPYIRVANVHPGRLNLDEVKVIRVSPEDALRYSLNEGDVLMTEGGDLDKLGRGTVWRDEVPHSLHQNHVFAVRVRRDQVSPEWISLHTESSHGRRYFLAAAKRTSNLASVNKKQVSAFPIGAIELDQQTRVLKDVGQFDGAIDSSDIELDALAQLQSTLSIAIFGGEQ